MSDNDKLLAELTRRSFMPSAQEGASPDGAEYTAVDDGDESDDFPGPDFDEYNEALTNARKAVSRFERASATCRARKKALAKLPFPWVQPALRMALWSAGAAITFFASPPDTQWWQAKAWAPAVFVSLGLLAGEGAGRAAGAFMKKGAWSTRLMRFSSLALFILLLVVNLVTLFGNYLPGMPLWFDFAVAGLSAAAATTLPWFGSSQNEYTKLLKAVESSTRRQNESLRKARKAVDRLNTIHAGHLRNIPASLKRFRKTGK